MYKNEWVDQMLEYADLIHKTLSDFYRDMENIFVDDFVEVMMNENPALAIKLLDSLQKHLNKGENHETN